MMCGQGWCEGLRGPSQGALRGGGTGLLMHGTNGYSSTWLDGASGRQEKLRTVPPPPMIPGALPLGVESSIRRAAMEGDLPAVVQGSEVSYLQNDGGRAQRRSKVRRRTSARSKPQTAHIGLPDVLFLAAASWPRANSSPPTHTAWGFWRVWSFNCRRSPAGSAGL